MKHRGTRGRIAPRLLKAGGALVAILTVLAAFAALAVTVLSVRVEGHSMDPTLADGQRLFVTPNTAGRTGRFDVVLLEAPGRGSPIVKRVIGLPGDRVMIASVPEDAHQVLVQPGGAGAWYRVVTPYRPSRANKISNCCTREGGRSGDPRAQVVPAGRFFYLGDNPDASDDSRTYGWGETATVRGRVGFRVWPLSEPREVGGRPVLELVENPPL
ncbi:signal peptidase I [Actinocorallia sp. API 0066]|uniref:signal peptidase I n=1 Tax=Actinocorallia sp. API 0066 TaxID=2896846 RepID=UPI001E429F62|nr:signal peptidase I [Actinocorallia sp. API 0066]MCD0451787.1 signal peptidase I [Actinocorallia sp. API 0066]